jgi:LacI family transcriptional regulator
LIGELTRRNIPTVFLDTGKNSPNSANLRIDYAQGIHEALQHLFSLNHKRIAFITGPLNLESARIRHKAFLSGLKAQGISERGMIEKGNHNIEGGSIAMKQLLKLPHPPTAVVASNDLTAIGALGAILEAGLKVPDDISLIGFDDISFAHLTQPPLTTVILSRKQLAVTAFAALERLIRKEDVKNIDYVIPTHLIMRSSTRAI